MHAQNLLPRLEELSPSAAERWVAAALAEAAALREHDDQLYPPADDPAALETAESLHDTWRRWAEDADTLLARLGSTPAARMGVAGAPDLDYAAKLACAMLKLSPQAIRKRREQVARGVVYSPEEARHELGLADRP